MTRKISVSIFVILLFTLSIYAQTDPTPTPEDVIRISSDLVLVDALVLDKDGNQVNDLTPDDFEIYQDGKLQEITNFSYIDGKTFAVSNKKYKKDKKEIPPPPITTRSNTGRIITFVVDDGGCNIPESMANARQSINRFINEKMRPDDRIAIYRTRGGTSLLQPYTSNKEVLKRAAKKIKWFPSRCRNAYDAALDDSTLKISEGGASRFGTEESDVFESDLDASARYGQLQGAYGVLSFAINRLKIVPQRKIIFFISEGINVDPQDSYYLDNLNVLKRISDEAIRSSVVIYTMNAKGLANPGVLRADDNVQINNSVIDRRLTADRISRSGMELLAEQTGGDVIWNKNFLENTFEDILQKENGYYLIGYEPDADTFKGKKFHNIDIKLKRENLTVSSLRGFYGREDKRPSKKASKNSDNPLYQAIASPFYDDGIDIRLTTLAVNNNSDNFIRAMFHVKGEDLKFMEDSDGLQKITLDVVAVVLDEKGKVAEEFNRTYPIRIPQRGVELVKQNGLDYSTDIPIKKPGVYSFRMAVRDKNSAKLGSAGDTVTIPNHKKDKFLISNLVTTSITKDRKPLTTKAREINAAFTPVFTESIPSIRKYKAGLPFAYTYEIYNAKVDSKTRQPNLTTQFRIYKDGKSVLESKETKVELQQQGNLKHIQDYGLLMLNEKAESGEYVLQLIIRDKNANKTSTEWVDFEIVR